VLGHGRDPLCDYLTQLADALSIFRNAFLAPSEGDRFEKGNKGCRGGDNNLFLKSIFDKVGVSFRSSGQEGVVRYEENDEFRRLLELRKIFFFGKLFDVCVDLRCVALQRGVALGV